MANVLVVVGTGVRRVTKSFSDAAQRQMFQHRCWASVQHAVKESASLDEGNKEWKDAKPFDQIPGRRSFPLIGSSWVSSFT